MYGTYMHVQMYTVYLFLVRPTASWQGFTPLHSWQEQARLRLRQAHPEQKNPLVHRSTAPRGGGVDGCHDNGGSYSIPYHG